MVVKSYDLFANCEINYPCTGKSRPKGPPVCIPSKSCLDYAKDAVDLLEKRAARARGEPVFIPTPYEYRNWFTISDEDEDCPVETKDSVKLETPTDSNTSTPYKEPSVVGGATGSTGTVDIIDGVIVGGNPVSNPSNPTTIPINDEASGAGYDPLTNLDDLVGMIDNLNSSDAEDSSNPEKPDSSDTASPVESTDSPDSPDSTSSPNAEDSTDSGSGLNPFDNGSAEDSGVEDSGLIMESAGTGDSPEVVDISGIPDDPTLPEKPDTNEIRDPLKEFLGVDNGVNLLGLSPIVG